METLSEEAKAALLAAAAEPPWQNPPMPTLPIEEFLEILSNLPSSLCLEKPVRFIGNDWKL